MQYPEASCPDRPALSPGRLCTVCRKNNSLLNLASLLSIQSHSAPGSEGRHLVVLDLVHLVSPVDDAVKLLLEFSTQRIDQLLIDEFPITSENTKPQQYHLIEKPDDVSPCRLPDRPGQHLLDQLLYHGACLHLLKQEPQILTLGWENTSRQVGGLRNS